MRSLAGKSLKCEGCDNAFIVQEVKKCPFCAEIIKGEAKVCRFCKSDQQGTASPSGSRSGYDFSPFDIQCEKCRTYIEINSGNLRNGNINCPHCGEIIHISSNEVVPASSMKSGFPAQMRNIPAGNSRSPIATVDSIPVYPVGGNSSMPKLYTPGQVAWASCLGSVLGGAILMALNAQRLKRDSEFSKIIVITVIGFAVWCIVAMVSPNMAIPSTFIMGCIQAGIMYWFSSSLQGRTVEEHISRGGEIASSWGATGAGLLGTVVAFTIIIVIAAILTSSGSL
ncbi:MAG TPA: hypothetical protein DET40_18495 [Lentisphaeria bacterium]|nr:MAG: hypothetical protein A2X45_14635 [Lentisphaerae bacterium GWF2_50_93]HCE45534.1 hypothetical protein [Lentisphaeria bacterium]